MEYEAEDNPAEKALVATSSERRRPPPGWQPGQSGNPGGKSKTEAQIATVARSHAPEMVAILMEIARGKKQSGAARVMAVQELFNRAFGKAPARVLVQTDIANMSNSALDNYMRDQLKQMVRTIEGHAGGPE
jgi:hypothetical protein